MENESNIYNMNPVEFNNFIKRLRQQYKQHTAEQKEQEKAQKEQEKTQKKQAAEQKEQVREQEKAHKKQTVDLSSSSSIYSRCSGMI